MTLLGITRTELLENINPAISQGVINISAYSATIVTGSEFDAIIPSDISATSLNTALDAVTGGDITSVAEGDWTNLLSISGEGRLIVETTSLFLIGVDTTEAAGASIRARVLIDGTTAFDAYVVRDAAGDSTANFYTFQDQTSGNSLYFKTSFVIQAVRVGTFSGGAARITFGDFNYELL